MEFLNTIKGLGTVVNVCAIIAGGLIGTFFGKKIKESIQDSLMKVLGLAVMFVGLSGALSKNADNRVRQTFAIRNDYDDYKSVARNAYRRAY